MKEATQITQLQSLESFVCSDALDLEENKICNIKPPSPASSSDLLCILKAAGALNCREFTYLDMPMLSRNAISVGSKVSIVAVMQHDGAFLFA